MKTLQKHATRQPPKKLALSETFQFQSLVCLATHPIRSVPLATSFRARSKVQMSSPSFLSPHNNTINTGLDDRACNFPSTPAARLPQLSLIFSRSPFPRLCAFLPRQEPEKLTRTTTHYACHRDPTRCGVDCRGAAPGWHR